MDIIEAERYLTYTQSANNVGAKLGLKPTKLTLGYAHFNGWSGDGRPNVASVSSTASPVSSRSIR